MTGKKDTWADLGRLWQEENGFDAKVLARKVRRKTLQMKAMFLFEFLIGLAGVGIGIWLLATQPGLFEISIGLFAIFGSIAGVYFSWRIRRGAWKAQSDSVRDNLELTLARAKSGLRLAHMNLYALIPAVLFVAFVFAYKWGEISASPERLERAFYLLAAGGAFFLGNLIWAVWYRRLKKKEIAGLNKILADMADQD